jgi:FkbM family methyltransferase
MNPKVTTRLALALAGAFALAFTFSLVRKDASALQDASAVPTRLCDRPAGGGVCEVRGAVTVGAPWSSLLLGGESNACIARSFDGTYSFFTFDPSVDVFVSAPMIRDGGLYDHMVHAALEDTLERSRSAANAHAAPAMVVDAGANIGTLTLFASSRGCTVVSYELQSRVARMLDASLLVNGFHNAVVRLQAVSDAAGQNVTYADVPQNPGGVSVVFSSSGSAERTVQTVTLDGEFPPPARIQFLKIDTEGHELPILRGAKSLFSEHRVESVVRVQPFSCLRQPQAFLLLASTSSLSLAWRQLQKHIVINIALLYPPSYSHRTTTTTTTTTSSSTTSNTTTTAINSLTPLISTPTSTAHQMSRHHIDHHHHTHRLYRCHQTIYTSHTHAHHNDITALNTT